LESMTFGLVQLISDLLGKIGLGDSIPVIAILACVIIAYAIALFTIVVCLYIIHAKLVNLINRIKMKRNLIWKGHSKNNKRFNFEDQFDELFARS
jgi:hypothetical protein